jgi:hypothetical protein
MKALIKLLLSFLIPLAVIGIWSCENRNDDFTGKGKAEFSLSMPDDGAKSSSGSSLDSGIMSYHIMVSIEDMGGNSVISDSLIPVYAFGTGFTSENVELQSGDYNLTKFLVINPTGTVIYASPVEGSPLAYLVNDPLPLVPDWSQRLVRKYFLSAIRLLVSSVMLILECRLSSRLVSGQYAFLIVQCA